MFCFKCFEVLNFGNSLIFRIDQFQIFHHFWNQSIIAILKVANFPNYKFWEFSKLDTFGIWIFFLVWKIIRIPKFSNFWNCSSTRYSAPFAIFSIFLLPFDINFIFYCGDPRKFDHSTFARSLIFKFEISTILKFYCSKFWPSPNFNASKKMEKFILIENFVFRLSSALLFYKIKHGWFFFPNFYVMSRSAEILIELKLLIWNARRIFAHS